MASKRYTIIVADRSSGVIRRATFSLRPVMLASGVIFTLPVLIGIGAAWKAKSEVADLRATHQSLESENASYRSATLRVSRERSWRSAPPDPTAALSSEHKLMQRPQAVLDSR